jgi:DeoD family purine-nucleoside phosphorylase
VSLGLLASTPYVNLAPVTGPIHLQPTAQLAERVLLPGDPGRALLLAQTLIESPLMFNHNRGLWGYTGRARDGELLTIQSTGMGGPSAAIVISELAELGARQLLRVGTCGALDPELELADLVIATEAIGADGTSRALGVTDRVAPDAELLDALRASGDARTGAVVCTDLFYDDRSGQERAWLADGAAAVEMESATLFALAAARGLQAGSLLLVSDLIIPERVRIGAEALRDGEQRMGQAAVLALTTLAKTAGAD